MWLRRLGKSLLGTAIVIIAILIVCLALFQNKTVKESSLAFVENKVLEKTGWQIKIDDVEGLLPLQFHVKNLLVTAPDTSKLTIEKIHLMISPWKLLRGHLCVHFADLQNVKIQENLPALNLSGTVDLSRNKTELRIKMLGFHEDLLARKAPFEIDILMAGKPSAWRKAIMPPIPEQSEEFLTGNFMSKSSCIGSKLSESFAGDFRLSGNRSLYLEKLRGVVTNLHSPVLGVEGDLTFHADGTLYSQLKMHASDLAHFDDLFPLPVKGQASITAVISGNSDHKDLSIDLVSPEIQVDRYPISSVGMKSQMNFTHGNLKSDFEMSAYLQEIPMRSFAALTWDNQGRLDLSKFNLEVGKNTVAGELRINLLTYLIEGMMEAYAPQLSDISLFAKNDLSGTGNLKVNFLKDRIELEGLAKNLTIGKNHFEELHLESDIKELIRGSLKLNAKNSLALGSNYQELDFFTEIDLNPDNEQLWPYTLALKSTEGSHLDSAGSWHTDNFIQPEVLSLVTDHFHGQLGNQPFNLTKPITFKSSADLVVMTPLFLDVGDGNLKAELSYTPEQLFFNLDAANVSIGLLRHFNDKLSHTGTINISSQLSGKPSDIIGTIDVDFKQMNFDELALSRVPPFDGAFSASLKNERLKASGALTGLVHWPITFDAEIPFSVSVSPPKALLKMDDPISAQFRFNGEIAPIFQLLIANTTSVTGQASSTINVRGTLAQPEITGEMELIDGAYESLLLGGVFKNLRAKIIGEGNQLKLTELSAEDGDQGKVTATGAMTVDPENNFPYEMKLKIDHCNMLHLDYAKGTTTGELILKGDMQKKTMAGELNIDQMSIRIPEELPVPLSGIEITYVNMPKDEPHPTHYLKKKKSIPVQLDVSLNARKNLTITKKDFTSEWHGSVHLTGTDEEMLVDGELLARNGRYEINGKSFELNNGSITFAGDPANKTSLYITASQQIDDVNVDLILKGPIKKPIVTFRSNPPFPQKEILSLILFNRASSDISASQNAQLNQSIITLSGGGQSGLLGKLRRSFGIDRIDIGSKDSADANEVTLRIGKYLSKKIFLSLNKGINSETNQVSIEAKLSKQFKAQAEINSDAEGRMTLRWQKDY